MYVPSKLFFTRGVGVHKEKLSSFELALRSAGIAQFNLVRVSSIYPPECKIVTRAQGLKITYDYFKSLSAKELYEKDHNTFEGYVRK